MSDENNFRPCPRPWTGDNGTASDCIAKGHCGCEYWNASMTDARELLRECRTFVDDMWRCSGYKENSEPDKRWEADRAGLISRIDAFLAQPAASEVRVPEGWKIERINKPPFKYINLRSPDGCVAVVGNADMNPKNVLYKLADAMLAAKEDKPPATMAAAREGK